MGSPAKARSLQMPLVTTKSGSPLPKEGASCNFPKEDDNYFFMLYVRT
jgi:hypothetical protein